MALEKANDAGLSNLAGYLIRRLQQIAVGVFTDEMNVEGLDLTPMQYAALRTVHAYPGLDQAELAALIQHDRTTTGGVVDRLVNKGLIRRDLSGKDRRMRLLAIEPRGEELLRTADHVIQRVEQRILDPLGAEDRNLFVSLLRTLVAVERTGSAVAASAFKRA